MTEHSQDLVTLMVTAQGAQIPETFEVLRLETTATAGAASRARLTLVDEALATGKFLVTDSKTFDPGTEIRVFLGYHTKNSIVFTGRVTKLTVGTPENLGSCLIVEAVNPIAPNTGQPGSAVATLTYGENIYDFQGTLDASDLVLSGGGSGSARISVTVKTPGNSMFEVGQTVDLVGISDRLSGPRVLAAVHHDVAEGNWVSTLDFY